MFDSKFLVEYNNDKSGKFSRENWLVKNYYDEYKSIISFCEINKLTELPFKEMVYHAINNISEIIRCKNINCKNVVSYKNSSIGYYDYCSPKCIGTDPNIIKQKEEKSMKKFGTKTPAESSIIKNKIISTNNKKYGGNSPMCNREVKEKSIHTLQLNYGVDNPAYSKELISRRVSSFIKNIESYKMSYRKTSIERYGVDHPWMNSDVHNKSTEKFYINYKDRVLDKLSGNNYNDEFVKFEKHLDKSTDLHLSCALCKKDYVIASYNFYFRVNNGYKICTQCNPIGDFKNISNIEEKLSEYISSIYKGEIVLNSRNIISPYELDIFLPSEGLAIEFNGLYWHSEINKPKDYHYNKSKLCEEKGIKLIHIWEDDWVYNEDIIKSVIENRIGITQNTIYARKCDIRLVDYKESRLFLDDNHIQGNSSASIRIGLYHNNMLMSIMTFGKLRTVIGHKHEDNCYELIRFCNSKNVKLVGGASKLFKYFINTYSPINIISYSDNSIFDGSLYEKLGFDFDSETKIGYHWVVGKKRRHRYNYRKSELIKMGYDSNKSEREIMYEDVGAYRIWNCAQKKWIWKNSKL